MERTASAPGSAGKSLSRRNVLDDESDAADGRLGKSDAASDEILLPGRERASPASTEATGKDRPVVAFGTAAVP